jgi:hypothetical protein
MAKKKKLAKKPAAKPKAAKRPVKKLAKKEAVKGAAKKAKKPAKAAAPKAGPKLFAKIKKAAKGLLKEKPVAKAKAPAPVLEGKKGKKKSETTAPAKSEIVDIAIEVETTVVEATEEASEEIVLTDAEGRRYCRVKDCDQTSVVDGYCRYHYLLYWKRIQVRKKILGEGKLERYIEELTSRYPDKYLEMLKKDLKSEKDFLAAIQELEIDESGGEGEFEDEAQNYIDEVRGMSEAGTAREDEEF